MSKENLGQVLEVIHRFQPQDVSKYVKAGWMLIEAVPGKDESGYPLMMYALGRTAESKEVE